MGRSPSPMIFSTFLQPSETVVAHTAAGNSNGIVWARMSYGLLTVWTPITYPHSAK